MSDDSNKTREIDPLSLQLGKIIAQLDMVLRTQSEDRVASAQYRSDMRKEISNASDCARGAAQEAKDCKNAIGKIQPIVDELKLSQNMSMGAKRLAMHLEKIFYILIGAGSSILAVIIEHRWRSGS